MSKSSVDNEFYRKAVEKYADLVVRIAYHNVKNQADAEDITQEVFMKLMKQPEFNDDGHLKAWLIRVTINQCKDLQKSFWHKNTESLDDEYQQFDDEQQFILDELWKLSPKYRNVIYLYFYEEYTIREIAKILNKNENTVSSWLTRGKKKLKSILIEGGYKNER